MVNPRYAGIDRLGRPFVVTAAVGRQVPDRQDLMSLRGAARRHEDAWRRRCRRDRGDRHLSVAGASCSTCSATSRWCTRTARASSPTRARVDVAHNTAEGNDPVEGHGPSGDIKAQGFRILDKGDTIIFTGHPTCAEGRKPATATAAPACRAGSAAAAAAASSRRRSRRWRPRPPSRVGTQCDAAAGNAGGQATPPLGSRQARRRGQELAAARCRPAIATCRRGCAASRCCGALLAGRRTARSAQVPAKTEPLQIQADSGIEWQQDEHVYIARGNAVATRGTSEVHADTLIAHYREAKGAASRGKHAGGNTEIYRRRGRGPRHDEARHADRGRRPRRLRRRPARSRWSPARA